MKKLILTMFVALAIVGCKSELDNKPAAEVTTPEVKTEVTKVEEKKEEAVAEAKMNDAAIDMAASSVEFVGAKVSGDHPGGFKTWTGKAWTDDKGELAKVEIDVDTTTLWATVGTDEMDAKLTEHLKSPDFFDVAKFPKAKFVSKTITAKPAGDFTHEITGDMTIRDQTKTITFPATVKTTEGVVTATSEFKLKRFDFGIAYKGKADDLIKDEVLMKLKLAAKPSPKG